MNQYLIKIEDTNHVRSAKCRLLGHSQRDADGQRQFEKTSMPYFTEAPFIYISIYLLVLLEAHRQHSFVQLSKKVLPQSKLPLLRVSVISATTFLMLDFIPGQLRHAYIMRAWHAKRAKFSLHYVAT